MTIATHREAGSMSPEERLGRMGLVLPDLAPAPVGNFANAIVIGSMLFVSGQGPVTADGRVMTGKVGGDVGVDEAYEHARLAGLNLLAVARQQMGDLSLSLRSLSTENGNSDVVTRVHSRSDLERLEITGGTPSTTTDDFVEWPGRFTVRAVYRDGLEMIIPMSGVMSPVLIAVTIPVNAAPMMTATARSTTLPRKRNFLKSSITGHLSLSSPGTVAG